MDYFWWDYRYDPTTSYVTVRRWRRRGNTHAAIDREYTGLTWGEAQDVFDADSTSVLMGRYAD